jgi:hypothetical protein
MRPTNKLRINTAGLVPVGTPRKMVKNLKFADRSEIVNPLEIENLQ